MKFSSFCLSAAFGSVALAAGFVGYKVAETALDPHHPNFFGLVILGQMAETHYPGPGGAYPYDEYLRNRYLAEPQMAYDHLKDVYGIQFDGDHAKAYTHVLNQWVGTEPRTNGRDNSGEYGTRSALLMFLSLKAFNREVYNTIDGMGLCIELSKENNARLGTEVPQGPQCTR